MSSKYIFHTSPKHYLNVLKNEFTSEKIMTDYVRLMISHDTIIEPFPSVNFYKGYLLGQKSSAYIWLPTLADRNYYRFATEQEAVEWRNEHWDKWIKVKEEILTLIVL